MQSQLLTFTALLQCTISVADYTECVPPKKKKTEQKQNKTKQKTTTKTKKQKRKQNKNKNLNPDRTIVGLCNATYFSELL